MENEEKHPIKLQLESVSNFLKSQSETTTKQLADNSKGQNLGDPLDVKLNKMDGPTGSDSTEPTVSVKVGSPKGGSKPTAGQRQANFSTKTELAENDLTSADQVRKYIKQALREHFDNLQEEIALDEGTPDELLGEPTTEREENKPEESVEEVTSRCHAAGRSGNQKPSDYPNNLKR